MTPGAAKTRAELPWLYYPENPLIINAHNFPSAGARPVADYRGLQFSLDTGNGAKTWSASDVGTASADRIVVVAVYTRSPTPISGLTIGGNTATNVHTQIQAGGAFSQVSLWMSTVPTGTTADIAYTYSNVNFFQAVSVTAITGASTTATDAGGVNGGTFSLTTTATGLLLGYHFNLSDPNYGTWTGLTAVDNEYQAGGFGYSFSHASGQPTLATTTVGHTGGTHPCTAIISLAAA